MAGAGLAGLAFLPQGYVQGGQAWNQLQNQETDQAGQAAFGNWLKTLAGGTAPTTPTAPVGPGGFMDQLASGVQHMLPGSQPVMAPPGQGPPGYSPGPPPTGMAPPPLSMPPQGGGGGVPMQGGPPPMGGPGAPPMQPPVQGGGPPMGGGPPSGPMDWRQVAAQIARANPGIRPEALAAAVSRAAPLMSQDSQQQWRALQMQMQQERLGMQEELGRGRLDVARAQLSETERSHRATEEGREAGRTERQREFDTQEARRREALDFRKDKDARDFAMKEQAARDKVHSLAVQNDTRLRAQALREWQAAYNGFDKYMRNKINAQTQLGAKEKELALKELDAEWARAHQDMEELRARTSEAEQPPGQSSLQRGKEMLKQGQGTPTGQPLTGPGATGEAGPAPGRYRNPQTGETGTWDGKTWTPD